jgi:hypothetical protein
MDFRCGNYKFILFLQISQRVIVTCDLTSIFKQSKELNVHSPSDEASQSFQECACMSHYSICCSVALVCFVTQYTATFRAYLFSIYNSLGIFEK